MRATVGDAGEAGLLALLRRRFPPIAPDVLAGIGDDAAIVRIRGHLLVTKDLLVEGHDFRRDRHPPRLLGRKSLHVNLSDIAAMGGRPHYAVLGLGLPDDLPLDWVEAFLDGFGEAGAAAGTALVGGDLSGAPVVFISVTVLGTARSPVRRSGARPGDLLWVSGTLGDAAEGLRLLEAGEASSADPDVRALIGAQLDPSPPLALGPVLAARKLATAMIDLSDGLALDLDRLCAESRVGAVLEEARIPLSPALKTRASDPVRSALHGGEDFQLLFTAKPDDSPRLEALGRKHRLTRIGRITARRGLVRVDASGRRSALPALGFLHF